MSAEEEQRVVDPNTESDHGAESRCDRRDVDDAAQQADDRQTRSESDDRDAQRHHGRYQRSEHEEQNDECSNDADHFGGPFGPFLQYGRELAAELDLNSSRLGGAGGIGQRVQCAAAQVGRRGVELNRSERRRGVRGDRPRPGEWFGHDKNVLECSHVGNSSGNRARGGGIGHGTVTHVEYDHGGCAGPLREPLFQQINRRLRFHSRYLEVVDCITAADPVRPDERDQSDDPHDQYQPMVYCHPPTQPLQHVRHDEPPRPRG